MTLKPDFMKAFVRSSIFIIAIIATWTIFKELNTWENVFLTVVFAILSAIPWVMRSQAKITLREGYLIGLEKVIPISDLVEISYNKRYENMHRGTPVEVETVSFKSNEAEIEIYKMRYSTKEIEVFVAKCLEANPEINVNKE